VKANRILRVSALLAATLLFAVAQASADTLVSTGTLVGNSGTGIGSVFNIHDLNPGGGQTTEQGADVFGANLGSSINSSAHGSYSTVNGSYTVGAADDTHNGASTHIWQISTLQAGGINSGSNLGIVFQVNNAGVQSDPANWMSLTAMTLYVWNSSGTLIYMASCGLSGSPALGGNAASCGNPQFVSGNYAGTGTGTSGWLFTVSGSSLDSIWASCPKCYVGLGAFGGLPTGVSDGHENWYLTPITSTTPVPEPGSMALLGTGFMSLAGVVRRRFKK